MPQTELGFVVLKGEERRQLQRQIAYARAIFEIQYEGHRIEPFGAAQIGRAARRYRPDVYVSRTFVRQTQRQLPAAIRDMREFGDVQPLPDYALPSG